MRPLLLVGAMWVVAAISACSSSDEPSTLRSNNNPDGPSQDDPSTSSSSGSTASGGVVPDAGQDGTSTDANVTLPKYEVFTYRGLALVRSVTVHKNGGEDRVVYVEESKIGSYPATGPLPNGARFLMLVNGGGNFVIEKVGGVWQYGNLNTATTPATWPTTAPNASCSACHNGAAEPSTFTLPSLRRLVSTHKGEEITCPKGPGPTPCDASVYQ